MILKYFDFSQLFNLRLIIGADMKYIIIIVAIAITACATQKKENNMNEININKSEKEWKQELTDEEYRVLREKGTERPYTGEYNDFFEPGVYVCAACGHELFTSDTKFESHCGWPSFYDKIDKKNIKEIPDNSHGMNRTEVVCANCGGHLGHVFNDGPNPTGLRYCINSVSLNFVSKDEYKKQEGKDNESESDMKK